MEHILTTAKQKIINRENFQKLSAILAVIFLYAGMQLVGITCPIKYVTGISCAGCGMSRAWMALFRLDFKAAFNYHPLFFMPLIVVVIFLMKSRINKKIYKIIMFTVIALFGIIYVYRMIWENGDIVVFKPREGILFRLTNIFNT